MRPDGPRPLVVGPDAPEPPFPIAVSGPIVKGFGRGSAELGIPTANIPLAGLSVGGHGELESGVYYGWAGVAIDAEGVQVTVGGSVEKAGVTNQEDGHSDQKSGSESTTTTTTMMSLSQTVLGGTIFPMVMSLGYNPYYKNTVRSIEVHILHRFPRDFYGAKMNLLICGFIRPEYDYVSKESLVEDINVDIEVARRSLERAGYRGLLRNGGGFKQLTDFAPIGEEEAAKANQVARKNL